MLSPPQFKRLGLLVVILLGITGLLSHEAWMMPDHKTVTVRFLDVGQGDSAFVTGPSGQQVLIDGGPNMDALEALGKAMPFFDRTIDILVLSHPHIDHITAFPQILRRYTVGKVIISGAAYDNGPYQEFLALLKEERIPVLQPTPGQVIDLGDGLQMNLLWPPPVYFGKTVKSIHDTNVVCKLLYGKDSVLFAGDMEEVVEKQLMKAGDNLASTVLKVGHHGSKTSSGSGFLLAVHPTLAVISVAAKNSYGLPYPATLRKLTHFGIPYKTTMSGTVVWRMDGIDGL